MDIATTYAAAGLLFSTAKDLLGRVSDVGNVSLPGYGKMARISSRVWIDGSLQSDPVITDILKTVHTQYAAFILAAMQMNQFITKTQTVQDLLRVVASEAYQTHMLISDLVQDAHKRALDLKAARDAEAARIKQERETAAQKKEGTSGKIVSFAGDNHIPAGKIIEVTLTNPDNEKVSTTVHLMVQLAPYIVPEAIAVQFITKDVVPSLMQRWLQWKTGEIGFWKDFVFMSDIVNNRDKLRKSDPSGVLAKMLEHQNTQRMKALNNVAEDKALRARNLASSVLILNNEAVVRAKAESGLDLTDTTSRQRYFDTSFTMMIVVVDVLYNQVTFYYNGIAEAATFSFEQMKASKKGDGGNDMLAAIAALNQGKAPKF